MATLGDEARLSGSVYLLDRDGPRYLPRESLEPGQLRSALRQLELFSDDMFLSVQASRLDMVDQFILDIEARVLRRLLDEERTLEEAHFLAAQSEMWIFALYEVLRTWMQRARDLVKLADNGGFPNKLASLKESTPSYHHQGRLMRIAQIEKAMNDSSVVERLRTQLRQVHMPFTLLEFLRVAIAKHEISGKAKAIALAPGYGRINTWSGSLDYELENGKYAFQQMSRRDLADSFRYLDLTAPPPSDEDMKSFEAWVSGSGMELPPPDF